MAWVTPGLPLSYQQDLYLRRAPAGEWPAGKVTQARGDRAWVPVGSGDGEEGLWSWNWSYDEFHNSLSLSPLFPQGD